MHFFEDFRKRICTFGEILGVYALRRICIFEKSIYTLRLDPPRKARARSPNLQRTGLIGSVTSRDVTKSVNVVLAR